MIETLLVRQHARTRHLEGPLLKEREEYLSHLLRQGHSLNDLRWKASLLLHALRLLQVSTPRKIDLVEIETASSSWAKDVEFHKARMAGPRTACRLHFLALEFFRFHGLTIEPEASSQAFATPLMDFVRYLEEERGLTPGTIRSYSDRTARFLNWIVLRRDCLADVTLSDIDDYLDSKREQMQLETIKTICQGLRSFFVYLQSRGLCRQNFANGIRSPISPKHHPVPQGPAWRDVRRLLKFPAKTNNRDIRTKAILLLCAIYGMRSSEIAGLRLDDFDWYNEMLTVRRGKRGRIQQFPIQYEVGEAVLQYLRHVRPRCSCRNLFLTSRYPYRPVLPTTLGTIVRGRLIKLGIRSERMGPHALRHACATELLRKGSSLKDIADFLGHRGLKSISIYAKHDPKTLRRVAAFSLAGVK
jgi:integrase/recombinase XerD